MSKNKDEYLPLDDLAKALIDECENRLTHFDMVLDEWEIKGRRGERMMKFRIRLVASTDPDHRTGRRKKYVLSSTPGRCYEDATLTIDLPLKSMTLSATGE